MVRSERESEGGGAGVGYNSFYCKTIKPVISWLLALVGVLLFSWLYLLVALAVKLDDPNGPLLFKQKRLGLHGKVYWMYKFRSMKVNAEFTGSGVYSDDKDRRVTRIGKILRKTSLDEIPQLFNILRGELCFVGPRSPLTYHPWPLEQYSSEQRRMFEVRPGITGWAQIHGRKTVEWHKRIKMNVWYAEHVSLWLDLKILFMTVFKVLSNADNENIGATLKK